MSDTRIIIVLGLYIGWLLSPKIWLPIVDSMHLTNQSEGLISLLYWAMPWALIFIGCKPPKNSKIRYWGG